MPQPNEYMLKQSQAEIEYQKKLTAGTNITIDPMTNTISSAGGGSTVTYDSNYTLGDILGRININGTSNAIRFDLRAGDNINIVRDVSTGALVISSTGGSGTITDVLQENESVVEDGIAYTEKNHIILDEDGSLPTPAIGNDYDFYASKMERIDPEVTFVKSSVWSDNNDITETSDHVYSYSMTGTGDSRSEMATYSITNLEVGATYQLKFIEQISSSATFYNQYSYGTCISENEDGTDQTKSGDPGTYDPTLRFFSYYRDTDEHEYVCTFEATQETMYLVTVFGDVYDGTSNTVSFSNLTITKVKPEITDLWFKIPTTGWLKFYGTNSAATSVHILNSKAEWDALPDSKYTDGIIYVIKGEGGGVVKGVVANPSGEPVGNLSTIGIDGYIYNVDNGGASGSETVLVEDYEYCNFTGAGYIVLSQKINTDYKITVDFNIPAYKHNMGLIGHNNNDDNYLHVTQYTSGSDKWYMSIGSSETSFTNKSLTGRHTIVINDGTGHNTFDGDNVTSYTPINVNYNLTIGTSQGTQTSRLIGQIYSYKIESIANQTVIADLIPRKVTYNNQTIAEGFYDKISGNYYSCNGCTVGGTHSEPAGYNIYVAANPQKTALQTLNKIQIGSTIYQVEVASQGDNTVVPNPQGIPIENLDTLGFVREVKDYCLNNGLVAAPGGSYIYCNLDATMTIDKTYQVILRDGDNIYTSSFTWTGVNTSLDINGMTLAITSSQAGLTYYGGDWRNIYCDIYTIENETIVYQVMGSGSSGNLLGVNNPTNDLGEDTDLYFKMIYEPALTPHAIEDITSGVEIPGFGGTLSFNLPTGSYSLDFNLRKGGQSSSTTSSILVSSIGESSYIYGGDLQITNNNGVISLRNTQAYNYYTETCYYNTMIPQYTNVDTKYIKADGKWIEDLSDKKENLKLIFSRNATGVYSNSQSSYYQFIRPTGGYEGLCYLIDYDFEVGESYTISFDYTNTLTSFLNNYAWKFYVGGITSNFEQDTGTSLPKTQTTQTCQYTFTANNKIMGLVFLLADANASANNLFNNVIITKNISN